MRIHQDMW